MRKQLMVLVVLLILTGASVSALFVYQEDVRSELYILTPSQMKSDDSDALVRLGDSYYQNVSIGSNIDVSCRTDSGLICEIQVDASINQDYVYETFALHFVYATDGESLIPSDAGPDRDSRPGVSRQYIDPVTGTSLLFRESEGVLQSVRFTGMTVIGDDSGFEYAEFDLMISYESKLSYVNDPLIRDSGEDKRMGLQGSENGEPMTGDLLISPTAGMIHSHSYIAMFDHLSVDVPSSSIPQELLSAIMPVNDTVVNNMSFATSYLRSDGLYIVPDIQYRYGSAEDGSTVFSMSGTVTTYQLDADCNVISQETIEFSYGVVR